MKNFILRSGKYVGKSLEEIKKLDLSYVRWIEENRPEMLKEHNEKKKPKILKRIEPKEDFEIVPSAIQPNLNFFNEK